MVQLSMEIRNALVQLPHYEWPCNEAVTDMNGKYNWPQIEAIIFIFPLQAQYLK